MSGLVDERRRQLARGNGSEPLTDTGGWRPIETAPKDGTKIDLWVAGRGRLADRYWSDAGSITQGGWGHREIRNRRWVGMIEHQAKPTHWMPLPPPPTGSDAG